MRLTDADELIGKFAERYDEAFEQMHTRENKDYWNGVSTGVNWGKNTIADEPAVDAALVVHGRWVLLPVGGYASFVCSVCSDKLHWFVGRTTRYCPNCGAKMDGGDENAKK